MRRRPGEVRSLVERLPRDPASYYDVRARDPKKMRAIDRAARFFYLNRMAFNGVYRTNRKGEFNVPIGSRVGAMPTEQSVVASARVLRCAQLIAGDFQGALEEVKRDDFVYLDPPYTRSPAGNYGVYGYGSFDGGDLNRLVEAVNDIDRRGASFLLSYRDAPELSKQLGRYRIDHVFVTAQVGGRRARRSTRNELLVSNA